MENIIKKYKNSNVYMVAGLDSLGVPYTPDNIELKSYVDLVADEFKKHGINIDYVNLHSLARNKTWELKKILDTDYTKQEYYRISKRLNKLVIDKSKTQKIGFKFPSNPNFIDNYFIIDSNPDKNITTSLKTEETPIFLYSCGGMNIDYYFKLYTGNIKQILPQVTINLLKNIKQTINDVSDCINYVATLNPNIEVYVLGTYTIIENKVLRFFANPFYAMYNNALIKICSKYDNVHYVDIFGAKKYIAPNDCHTTFEGQKYITKQIIKVMNNKK